MSCARYVPYAGPPPRIGAAGSTPWQQNSYEDCQHSHKKDLIRDLRKRKVTAPKAATLQRLRHLLVRGDRGLLDYTKYETDHLKTLIAQRSLQMPECSACRGNIVARLEQADENMTFPKFTDLPPELRVHIFELYFASVLTDPRGYEAPSPPFLAQASRLLRKEALPVYYNTCRFVVAAERDLYADTDSATGSRYNWCFSKRSKAFIEHSSCEDLAQITRLRLQVRWHTDLRTVAHVHLDVDIPLKGKEYRVREAGKRTRGRCDSMHDAEGLVGGVVRGIVERPGTNRLMREDVERMIEVVSEAPSRMSELYRRWRSDG
ncbi:hypothetical protein LTR85_008506 [Meristemomyces frigidus]|nr:hypothetical protein LTR85_008506 [Meristemomyces frigidus]